MTSALWGRPPHCARRATGGVQRFSALCRSMIGFAALLAVVLSPLLLWQASAFADNNGQYQEGTFDDDCPSGMFLAGLTVSSGAWLNQIGIRCAPFDPTVQAFGLAQDVGHPMYGFGGSSPRNIDCAPHMAVQEIVGTETRFPQEGHVDNMFMKCSPADPADSRYSYITVNTDLGSSDGDIIGDLIANYESGSEDTRAFPGCDTGSFAIGIKVVAEYAIQTVDLDCQSLEDGRIGTVSTPLSVAPPSPPDVLRSLASKGPSFTIAKTPVGPCTGPVNGNYLCPYTITVTNTGALNYSGPITFVDKGGYQHDPVTFGGISQFACSGTADPLVVKYAKTTHLLTCSANTIVPAGSSITATAVATISGGDAAMSACGNVANSVSLKAPVDIGPVWGHATLPGSSGCSPSAGTTDGVVPPECPFGWYRVHDQSRLPATWVRQQLTMNEISILCAEPSLASTINPSDIIKLAPLLSPCPPLMHQDANGQCVRNPLIVPNNRAPHQPTAPKAGPMCPPPWREIVDPSSLSSGWVTRTISAGGITITCANFRIQLHPSTVPQTSDNPCDRQLRLPDGSCPPPPPKLLPQTRSPAINLHDASKLLICEDGQPRLKDGKCPPPKFHLNGIYRPPVEQPR